jgi:hypothetical protein
MTPADRVIADAIAAVIAAAVTDHVAGSTPDQADAAGHAAVRELRRLGWHITPLPTPTTHAPEDR